MKVIVWQKINRHSDDQITEWIYTHLSCSEDLLDSSRYFWSYAISRNQRHCLLSHTGLVYKSVNYSYNASLKEIKGMEQEAQLLPRDCVSAAHYLWG